MQVLIVDDNPLVREIIGSVVKVEHPQVTLTEAEDVTSALAEAGRARTDVAFVDIRLPDGSGLDVLARLREINPDAVLACCTAHDFPEYREEALRRGADFWISKESLDSPAILAVMAEALDGSNTAGAVKEPSQEDEPLDDPLTKPI